MRDREWWTRPALQKSEAILMPALQRRRTLEPTFLDGYEAVTRRADAFRTLAAEPTTALSTYVRPRGSMAGRSVLRAAGVTLGSYPRRGSVASMRALLPGRGSGTWLSVATRQRETARRRAMR